MLAALLNIGFGASQAGVVVQTVTPGAGLVSMGGLAAALASEARLLPGAGVVSLAGLGPSIVVGGAVESTVTPDPAIVSLVGPEPTVESITHLAHSSNVSSHRTRSTYKWWEHEPETPDRIPAVISRAPANIPPPAESKPIPTPPIGFGLGLGVAALLHTKPTERKKIASFETKPASIARIDTAALKAEIERAIRKAARARRRREEEMILLLVA